MGGSMERLSLTNADLFEDLILASDSHMNTVMVKVAKGDFASGEVNIRINFSYEVEEVNIPKAGDDFEIRRYKRPIIKYAIKSSLKQSFSNDASVPTDNYMVDIDDNALRLKRIDEDQLSMFGDDYD
ncbi:hypothetical protein HMPREF0077_0973 [Anaerococcus tetradius ATCC 35098]|uniref:Uncharacterized protein n=2 Tax=Anaerococcus tetradius TaxID=33036 RepID=C2CHL3_9FIRM|nr:hypothetical protein HMPREF0077_0973 [Anaerococcus tetradius ATCC 35098]